MMELDRTDSRPLKRQIYACIRDRIADGRLGAGDTLPSTRELAKTLNISRATVGEAYDMLIAEGFAVSRQGAPTRVAECLLMEKAAVPLPRPASLPARALRADFQTGRPDLRAFPRQLWRSLLSRAAAELPVGLYGYTGPDGLFELRAEISAWLLRSRGLEAAPDAIFITAGATHALHILTELLGADKKEVLMEDPCHSGMLQTFADRGCRIVPVPADASGLDTRLLPAKTGACAVYVTPSHQFPLGGILPAARRAALIRYARDNSLYVIEDDYDSEYRYAGDPVARFTGWTRSA
jgi:GntR family transcriptional regulator/MocR family aminotransferase